MRHADTGGGVAIEGTTRATNREGPRTFGGQPGHTPSWVEAAIADAVHALALDTATIAAVGADSDLALQDTRRLLTVD